MTTQTMNSFTKQETDSTTQRFIQRLRAALQQRAQQRAHRKTYFELLRKPSFLMRDIGLSYQQVSREIDRTSLLRWK